VTRRSKRIAAAASGGDDGPATRSSTQASFPAVAASPRKASHHKTTKASLIGSPLRAGHIKKSSATYRRQALKSGLGFSRTGKTGLVQTKLGSSIKGKDADHMVEAQTVADAVKKAGYSRKDITPRTTKRVKDIENDKNNMAAISPDLNTLKGRHAKSKLDGGEGSDDPQLAKYLDTTKPKTTEVAKDLTAAFKQGGYDDVDVLASHMKTLDIGGSKPKPDAKKDTSGKK